MSKVVGSQTKHQVWKVQGGQIRRGWDDLTTEEPLEIRLMVPAQTVAVTMRTPGADFDLTVGFLYSEGVITQREDVIKLSYCVDPSVDGSQRQNIINVTLKPDLVPDLQPLERHFFTTSSCGVCGKAGIEALKLRSVPVFSSQVQISADLICTLPEQLQTGQGVFQRTGGLHAAGLFTATGELLKVREDVGRHNAVDKLIGSALLSGEFPLSECIVLVSGRASFEILQKCLMAGISVLCAVSAPSHLAVSLAEEFGITLIGFLRGKRFNIYSGQQRIRVE